MTASRNAEPLSNWQTASMRATAFYSGQLDLGSIKWWQSLTGKSPDLTNLSAGLGQLLEQGEVEGHVLQLQIQPQRIDWLLLPKDGPQSAAFASLGEFDQSLTYFKSLVSRWLALAPSLNRLAFGAQLLIPTARPEDSIAIIAEILSYVTIDWEGIRDFTFQVNRPKACTTFPSAGAINRLIKWQSIIRKKVVMTLAGAGQTLATTAEQHAAYFELDVSTCDPSDAYALPPEKLGLLLGELMDDASEIVSRGDVL